MFVKPQAQPASAQQPTGSVPTVTGTPSGMIVALYLDETRPQESVYAGPGTNYPAIGLILAGQQIPAFGKSQDGLWYQIYYPGVPGSRAWVYGPFLQVIKNGPLPVLPPPPTPTPATTPVLDPTLAAAFIPERTATRLPTYTAPAPLEVATFIDTSGSASRIPAGLIILGLGFIGSLGVVISFLQGR